MALVVSLARAGAVEQFGGKAAQLAALKAVAQVQIPPGFAIAAEAFWQWIEATLPPAQWPERLIYGPASDRRGDRLAAIRADLLAAPLPRAIWQRVLAEYDVLGRGSVAVRSSALHEDTQAASAAGLHETILGVNGATDLHEAIRKCFASIYHERAMAYLCRGPDLGRVGIAVVVQRLVPADAAGVLFTVDPVGVDQGIMLVEAAHGLGCTVVDGSLAPDVYRIDRETGAVKNARIGEKNFAVRASGQGLERVALSHEDAIRPALGPDELSALAAAGRAIELASGPGRDIEWAFERGTLWVLQSRPIVGAFAGTKSTEADRATWVWSNVNVGEALPGVATPLTWSIAAAFSDTGFRRAFGALGCKVPHDAELVGQFHGRIYLNLTTFMKIAGEIPLLDPRMLLEFGGGGGLEMLEQQVTRRSWGRFLVRAPLVAGRFVTENAALSSRLESFERDFASERKAFESAHLVGLSRRELLGWLEKLELLLDRTGAVMLTCASGSLSSLVALRTLLRTIRPSGAAGFERELLTGIADLESAAPGIALVHLAELARREPAALAVITGTDAHALTVDQLPARGPTRRAFEAFLRAYGYRAAREAELATPRWRESPGPLFAVIQAQLERSDAEVLARVERQHAVRAQAEREIEAGLPSAMRSLVRHLLARARRFTRLRERMRARVTEVLGFFRTLSLEVSARMEQREPSVGADAVFYLRLDELREFLRGELAEIGPLVSARRADVARDLARPDPPPVFVGTPPLGAPAVVPSGDRLTGIAASPGCVTGTVRVLRDPAAAALLRPGEILVAPVADVGWTPLFLAAAAVVTELGGALSHAALVAREYGVPAVVNVSGATLALASGDRVRVDGDRGVVELLARAST